MQRGGVGEAPRVDVRAVCERRLQRGDVALTRGVHETLQQRAAPGRHRTEWSLEAHCFWVASLLVDGFREVAVQLIAELLLDARLLCRQAYLHERVSRNFERIFLLFVQLPLFAHQHFAIFGRIACATADGERVLFQSLDTLVRADKLPVWAAKPLNAVVRRLLICPSGGVVHTICSPQPQARSDLQGPGCKFG